MLIVMILLALACCVLAGKYLDAEEAGNFSRALWLKVLASGCFVAVGAIAMTGCWYTIFGYLVFGGLVCGFVGDILLAQRNTKRRNKQRWFVAGSVAFAIGHVLYCVALISFSKKVLYVAAPYALVGCVLAYFYVRKRKLSPGRLGIPMALYDVLVLFMGGCAAGAAVFAISPGTVLFAIGGLFFAISDNLLIVNTFGEKYSSDRNRGVHILYYSAQVFIAFSMIMLFVI